MQFSTKTINFQTVLTSVNYGGFEIDLLSSTTKGSLEKINQKHERKHKNGHAKFYRIGATCGCCMRDDLTLNKETGKINTHYIAGTQIKCSGSNTEALEVSDEGIIEAIRFFWTYLKTIELHLRNTHAWSKAKVELEIAKLETEEALKEKLELIISYRDLRAKRAKEEAEEAKKQAVKARKEAAKTEKFKATKEYFKGRCKKTNCPTCSASASTEEEVIEIFGLRKKKNAAGLTITFPQSYCKKCRSAQNRRRRAAKKAAQLESEKKTA